MVDLEGRLLAVSGQRAGGEDGAGVVDEYVDTRAAPPDLLGGGPDAVEGLKVGDHGLDVRGPGHAHRLGRALQLLRAAAHEHHPVTLSGDLLCRLQPDAVRGPGEDHRLGRAHWSFPSSTVALPRRKVATMRPGSSLPAYGVLRLSEADSDASIVRRTLGS